MPNDSSNSNTVIYAAQNRQAALFDAFDEYLERATLHMGIARDYGLAGDLPGMAYAMRKAKAYFKAAHDEMAEIVAERQKDAEAASGEPSAVLKDEKKDQLPKEWWEE